jgi:hypothetical protein
VSNEQKLQEITKTIAPSDIYYRRGDIRFFLLQYNKSRECNTFGWLLLHTPRHEIQGLLEKYAQTQYIGEVINQALFIFQTLGCVGPEEIISLLHFADADVLQVRLLHETVKDLSEWILVLRGKFES